MNIMVNEAKPVVWIKWKCKDTTSMPLPRSGHSMTLWRNRFFLFGGVVNGLSDPTLKKVAPSNEVWILDALSKNMYNWTKPANLAGDVPTPRANHTATTIKVQERDESIFIFGGLGEEGKLNDCYIWTPLPDCSFEKIDLKDEDCPAPRASHAACFYKGKVYIFGGNGGRGYENSVFKDLWSFDPVEKKWTQINYAEPNPSIPELRAGHTMFVHNNYLYVYGGWNTCYGHSTAIKYSFKKNEWISTDMVIESLPVWNHCGLEVESGPSWKYFSFGGSSKIFDETKLRERADCCNKITVCDLDDGEKMSEVVLEDTNLLPEPREDASMVYAQSTKNLLIFGGWNNEWYGDLYGICVSSIVGPSYSVKELEPDKGRISGGQKVILRGSKLSSGNIIVYFILGNKEKHTNGECQSPTEISFVTPSFFEVGPKDLEVRIKIDTEELSTNPVKFSIYYDTKPEKTIFFGPALLDGVTPGHEVCLYIRARNEFNENRLSGRDKFKVIATNVDDTSIKVEGEIEDLKNGVYKAKFTAPQEGNYKINVLLIEEKEGTEASVVTTDVRGSPVTVNFNGTDKANNEFVGNFMLTNFLKKNVDDLDSKMKELHDGVDTNGKNTNEIDDIIKIKNTIKEIEKLSDNFDMRITQCMEYYEVANLDSKKSSAKGDINLNTIKKLNDNLEQLKKLKEGTSQVINPIITKKTMEYQEEIKEFYSKLNSFGSSIKSQPFAQDYNLGYQKATELLEQTQKEAMEYKQELDRYNTIMENLNYPEETAGCIKSLKNTENELNLIDKMWKFIKETQELLESFKAKSWPEIDGGQMDETISTSLSKKTSQMRKELSSYSAVMDCVQKEITKWKKLVPLVTYLKSDSMKERHWEEFKKELGCPDLVIDENLKLQTFYDMEIHNKADQIQEITDKAVSEDKMGRKLDEIQKNWDKYEYELTDYPRVPGVKELKFLEDPFADLEENIQQIQSMIRNKYKAFYEDKIMKWKSDLSEINDVWVALNKTQVKWKFLESLFIGSDEIKKELPNETEDFIKINEDVKEILKVGAETKNILKFSTMKFPNKENNTERTLLEWLNNIIERLEICEKALNTFMDSKRLEFPRFYFMSPPDLLDVLSNGDSPTSINKHISKIIISMDHIGMEEQKGERPYAKEMVTRNGIETIPYTAKFQLTGKVERYLHFILDEMRKTMKDLVRKSYTQDINNMSQMDWITNTCSQVCLLTDLMKFVGKCEDGITNKKIQQVYDEQLKSLNALIKSILDKMTEETMAKVMVLIKAETHSRDVIERLINEKVERVDDFVWQSQMKAYWDSEKDDCHLNVCDAELWYGYEYLGNGDRLVVTPLTDRIYVTATQALHLKMGCSPAGPAGTGKTETTKDLSSAMGKACYVFNCSEQMDYQTMGDIFRGLAASGSWGCFDEFNRLIPEVLSVCSMQFKCVTDGLKKNKTSFVMDEKECALDPTCGVFITMNPGYLGRSELPEGLKALFRPITVVVPDFELIAENCLMAQGFEDAKMLAKKFVVLYALCEDLLSKQAHYDWGLRAIKSVLVVAGAFKRADRDMSELQLLKRALRDFNYPKIVQDDVPVFDGLIGDLFPNIEVARKVDKEFEEKVREACLVLNEKKAAKGVIADDDAPPPFKLTKDEQFILKCIQLKELIEIRHSVFVMGNAGSGKTSCWRTLAKAFDLYGKPTFIKDLNPKSILADDLYGKYINMQTRDFKMGILSKAMKDFSSEPDKNQKWIILDGDLDAHWIENMNSVMDDNKVLTLPNNDRIDLLPHMRMFFEIRDLKFASKATVSRAGILFIPDDSGYQWRCYYKSWILQMCFRSKIEQETNDYFDLFLAPCLKYLKKEGKFTVEKVFSITFVVGFCKMLEAYIDKKEACIPKNKKKITKADDDPYPGYDLLFCFCAIWSMGSILSDKDGEDHRRKFSDWFRSTFKQYRIPTKGTVFDYYVVMDPESPRFEEWTKKISEIEYHPSENIRYVTVPTSETVSVSEIMDRLLAIGHPTLLIGMAGCGKTQIARGMLETARIKGKGTNFAYVTVNFNYYSDTYIVQSVLKENTQKKFGNTFGPKNDPKLMAIFVDDLNMQQLDRCMTQNAIELIRQFMDYKHIYECAKMELMEFVQIQFIAAMNPTAGSFNINPRLQRHFWICSIPFPSDDNIRTIFQFFLSHHFEKFHPSIQEISKGLVVGIVKLHKTVFTTFRKSAINFHYEFNIRHITGVFQGVLMSTVEKFQDAEKVAKLWVHECERVYGDRLVTPEDLSQFRKDLGGEIVKTAFGGKYNLAKYLSDKGESIIFCRFVGGYLDSIYDMAKELKDVRDKANLALTDYNDQYTRMDLVLFEDAVKHVCRITRIISQPSGHACLVGVGGSGKQSLSKLSSFICQYNVYMITISSEYKMNNFKEDLQKMMNSTGGSDDYGL
ncbi:MAG: AAA family ATPase, partial [archaeon]|nr:AAA family ATPase [archaeon]